MSGAVVIIRGNPDSHDPSRMQQYIKDNQIQVMGEGEENGWFYDYRSKDSGWAFERYEDRLAFMKGVERGSDLILVEQDFFFSIGQEDRFQQKLVQEVMSKAGMELVCIDGDFVSDNIVRDRDSDELFQIVMRYEKLRTTLSRIRTKQKNQDKGVITVKGKGKIGGRKSYLETDPELVRRVRKLRMGKHTNSEISKILFDLGYKTKTGNPFGRGMITRLYQQSEFLPKE